MKIIITTLMVFFSYSLSYSQIKGQCVSTSGTPIPHVNIAVNNTDIGTVTNSEGFFILDNEKLTDNNNLIISHIGFETKSIFISRKSDINIELQEIDYQLDEVNIDVSNYEFERKKRIGNNKLSSNVVMSFSSKNLGTEAGKYFKVPKKKKYKVERIHFSIQELGYKSVTFRINFYKAKNENDIEKTKCNSNDIVVDISKIGDVDIDLSEEKLIFDNDFLVSIEWISFLEKFESIPENEKKILFDSNVFCGPFYSRPHNLIKWRPHKTKYNTCIGMQLYVMQ